MHYNLSIKLVRDLDHNYEYIDDNYYKPIIVSDANYWLLLLLPLPLCCVFGNGLVVISVFTNRSLKTCTNFLLVCSCLTLVSTFIHKCVQVSLAVADLIVGALVMPFSIYMAVCCAIYSFAVRVFS
jgi:hypothetical protein